MRPQWGKEGVCVHSGHENLLPTQRNFLQSRQESLLPSLMGYFGTPEPAPISHGILQNPRICPTSRTPYGMRHKPDWHVPSAPHRGPLQGSSDPWANAFTRSHLKIPPPCFLFTYPCEVSSSPWPWQWLWVLAGESAAAVRRWFPVKRAIKHSSVVQVTSYSNWEVTGRASQADKLFRRVTPAVESLTGSFLVPFQTLFSNCKSFLRACSLSVTQKSLLVPLATERTF